MTSKPITLAALTLVAATASVIKPATAAIFKHIILVIQENRTPDNLFGSNPTFEPGVDIATSGINSRGVVVKLGPLILGSCYDLGHGHRGFLEMLKKGADKESTTMPSGCVIPLNPEFKYVANADGTVQPYFDIATGFGFANRMFQTNQGPSYPAHQFLFGGTSAPSADTPLFVAENPGKNAAVNAQTGCTSPKGTRIAVIDQNGDETTNPRVFPCFVRPTLADKLRAAGLSWKYYTNEATGIWTAPNSLQALCGAKKIGGVKQCTSAEWNAHVVAGNPAQVLTDVANCQLSAMSWVTPSAPESDHAAANDGLGPAWVASIVNAIGLQATCPGGELYWKDTAILVTWDDWGGWYDHVPPPQITAAPAWGAGYTYGFRVPLLVVSAYTPSGFVSNTVYDFGSLLYFIETNFSLGFIGAGTDAYSNYADYYAASRGNMSEFFTLTTPKPFTPIAAGLSADYFVHQPPSTKPVDTE